MASLRSGLPNGGARVAKVMLRVAKSTFRVAILGVKVAKQFGELATFPARVKY
jgi:hypothetical protein